MGAHYHNDVVGKRPKVRYNIFSTGERKKLLRFKVEDELDDFFGSQGFRLDQSYFGVRKPKIV